MANYMWDFGFDFNAVQQPDGTYYLQNGFLMIGANVLPSAASTKTVVNVPATPVDLEIGDMIGFNVFNVTQDPPTGDYVLLNGSITFTAAVENQTNESPFTGSNTLAITSTPPIASGGSTVFGGVQATGGPEPPALFPLYPGPPAEKVVNSGRFLVSASVMVQKVKGDSTTIRQFSVDPEMIIGGAG